MKVKTLLLGLLILCSLAVQAQINLKQAHIVANDGDTIVGYIDFRTNKQNAAQCLFKKTLDSEQIIYQPGDIAGYRFTNEGKKYISSTIKIGDEERSVFLEYLVKGMMSLYYYQDDKTDQEYYFFENESGNITQVTKEKDVWTKDLKIIADNKYIGILTYLFKDTPEVIKKPSQLVFQKNEMISLVEKYHNEVCTTGDECIEFEYKYSDRKLKTKISVFGGVNFYRYKIGHHRKFGTTSATPTIGVQANFMNPRWSRSISIQVEGALTQVNSERKPFIWEYITGDKHYAASRNKALVWNTSISPKFTYPKGRLRPSIEVGLNTSFLFSKSYKLKTSGGYINNPDELLGLKNFQPVKKYDNFQTFMIGVHAALGLDYELKDESFVILRIGYDASFDSYSEVARMGIPSDELSGFSIKTGYTF